MKKPDKQTEEETESPNIFKIFESFTTPTSIEECKAAYERGLLEIEKLTSESAQKLESVEMKFMTKWTNSETMTKDIDSVMRQVAHLGIITVFNYRLKKYIEELEGK